LRDACSPSAVPIEHSGTSLASPRTGARSCQSSRHDAAAAYCLLFKRGHSQIRAASSPRAWRRAINCTQVVAAGASQFGWAACRPVRHRDIAYDETAAEPKEMTVIADIDTGRSAADTAPPRCVSARSLRKAADARTRPTQDAASTLHGRSKKREATPRRSGHRMTATARPRLRPQEALPNGRLRPVNPLIPKAATASGRTDRKKGGSFYSVGQRVTLSARHGALRRPLEAPSSLIRCSKSPDPMTQVPCSGAGNCLLIFLLSLFEIPVPRRASDRRDEPRLWNDGHFHVSRPRGRSLVPFFRAQSWRALRRSGQMSLPLAALAQASAK
jgi:hypothetical protein